MQRDAENMLPGKEFEADLTLFPISAVVPNGYRLRLSLASGDSPQFGASKAFQATIFASSELELPTKQRSEK